MVDATVRFGRDTWVGSAKPAANHNSANKLALQSGAAYGFVYLKTPVPAGYVVVSATLTLYVANTAGTLWNGTKTLSVKRVAASWKPGALTWNNMPGTTGTTTATATVTNATDGQTLTFDVTNHLQTVSGGASWYGWRVETDSATLHRIWGFDSTYPPTLTVTYSEVPSTPTDLSPQGGAVGLSKPYLSFSSTDLTHPGDLASVQVQIDPAASTTSPGFDSGEVATSVPELNLATTSYAGLADGATTQWRARVKNSLAIWSSWSQWVSFSRDDRGTVNITSPAASPNNFVSEATPPITWTFTGETQAAYQVRITDQADTTYILADSGKIAGTDTSWTVPKHIIYDDGLYVVFVRVWDTKTRVSTPGSPRYAQASQAFTFNYDATVTAPSGLTAAPDGITPWINLTWTRATAPDSWTILRDGKTIESDIDPGDTTTSDTHHAWVDNTATPNRSHTYEVRAVVNKKASPKSNTATAQATPRGIWLLDRARNVSAVVFGDDAGTWAMPDQAGVYTVIGSDRTVRIVTGQQGLEGSITGELLDFDGLLASDQEAALMKMKGRPVQPYQLVLPDCSLSVELGNLTVAPTPASNREDVIKAVSFDFWQVGNLPFDSVV